MDGIKNVAVAISEEMAERKEKTGRTWPDILLFGLERAEKLKEREDAKLENEK